MKRPKTFWVVVQEDLKHIFNLHGPVTDDRQWIDSICEAKKAGRHVRCQPLDGTLSRNEVINQMSQTGYTLSEIPILEPPEDRSTFYLGSLPQYAQGANKKRLVKILCKGKCSKQRLAEMSIDYPGEDILSKMDMSQVTAKCLKCGYIAKDPYNWFR
jgi:hypothetical protein